MGGNYRDTVKDVVLWTNPRETGIVFGSILVLLLAVKYISVISVVGNVCLALVTSVMGFRIYNSALSTINKTQGGHPFAPLLKRDIAISEESAVHLAKIFFEYFNRAANKLQKIYCVEDILETLKFAISMYLLTYIGALVNIGTLLIICWVLLFSAPRIYRDNQKQIDEALSPLELKVNDLTSKVKAIFHKKEQ